MVFGIISEGIANGHGTGNGQSNDEVSPSFFVIEIKLAVKDGGALYGYNKLMMSHFLVE